MRRNANSGGISKKCFMVRISAAIYPALDEGAEIIKGMAFGIFWDCFSIYFHKIERGFYGKVGLSPLAGICAAEPVAKTGGKSG
jgi:hypothetical protein